MNMSNKNKEKIQKIRTFWEKYEQKVVLTGGLILIAIISFEAGILQGHKFEQGTLVIEKAVKSEAESLKIDNGSVLGVQAINSKAGNPKIESSKDNKECLLVGSKNSTKYHKPDCRFAKNIKPENLVCFKSEEDAKSRGYAGDKGCIK
ncbi:MAG: putative secreted protein [uncultured bacterium]|nr:MAG: putative secreted protein [uncultured bacterium]HBR79088.1 hypothetical protein [Candidatus Moranbacteria bacterium]